MADPNTRQGKRTPVTLKIKFKSETLEQFIERYAVDVSQGGIFIRTKEPLAVGTQMRFEFQLRDASPLIGGEGTVVWTRENDPSRPAIAPGMGVRFDRLADGSQSVLERILSEKAKQTPSRSPTETTKPPLFTDTPTRVAPPPVQEALLNQRAGGNGTSFPDQQTPLPKPMPFHSDADEFPDEAFEEATKVRALDELIARTADANVREGLDELAQRRAASTPVARHDSTLADPPTPDNEPTNAVDPSPMNTLSGFASGRPSTAGLVGVDDDLLTEAPVLPRPASSTGKQPRLLDTSPSPRTETGDQSKKVGQARVSAQYATTRPSAVQPVAVETTASVRSDLDVPRRSIAPMIVLALVVLAGGGAALWFFVLREKAVERTATTQPSGSAAGSSAVATGTGSASEAPRPVPPPPPPPVEVLETEIAAVQAGATVEVVGTDQKGPAPFKAKLEKDKPYKVRVAAPAFVPVELDVTGGAAAKVPAVKLEPKPRVIQVASSPEGALIVVDGVLVGGQATPSEVTLSAAQAAKKSVRVGIRKAGFRAIEKVVDLAAYTEEPARLIAKLDEKMAVQQVAPRPPPPPPPPATGSGSATGSDSGTPAGSATEPGSAAPPPPAPPAPAGSAAEPTPDFVPPPN